MREREKLNKNIGRKMNRMINAKIDRDIDKQIMTRGWSEGKEKVMVQEKEVRIRMMRGKWRRMMNKRRMRNT